MDSLDRDEYFRSREPEHEKQGTTDSWNVRVGDIDLNIQVRTLGEQLETISTAYDTAQQAVLAVAYYDKLIRQLNSEEAPYEGDFKRFLDDAYRDMVDKAYVALGLDYDDEEVEFGDTIVLPDEVPDAE